MIGAALGSTTVMVDHGEYFNLGQAATGDLHATTGLWGPALCDTPLLIVDDNRRYSGDELRCLALCAGCRSVALVRARSRLVRERRHRRTG
jgi:hypothetical protein